MYNRYIPQAAAFRPVSDEPPRPTGGTDRPPRPTESSGRPPDFLNSLLKKLNLNSNSNHELSELLRRFHLEKLDTGDILLALILLLMILEDGDHFDVIITLGLMLLFSLTEP